MSDKAWHELTVAEQIESIRQRMEDVTEEEILEALRDDDEDETDDIQQSEGDGRGFEHTRGGAVRRASASTPTA